MSNVVGLFNTAPDANGEVPIDVKEQAIEHAPVIDEIKAQLRAELQKALQAQSLTEEQLDIVIAAKQEAGDDGERFEKILNTNASTTHIATATGKALALAGLLFFSTQAAANPYLQQAYQAGSFAKVSPNVAIQLLALYNRGDQEVRNALNPHNLNVVRQLANAIKMKSPVPNYGQPRQAQQRNNHNNSQAQQRQLQRQQQEAAQRAANDARRRAALQQKQSQYASQTQLNQPRINTGHINGHTIPKSRVTYIESQIAQIGAHNFFARNPGNANWARKDSVLSKKYAQYLSDYSQGVAQTDATDSRKRTHDTGRMVSWRGKKNTQAIPDLEVEDDLPFDIHNSTHLHRLAKAVAYAETAGCKKGAGRSHLNNCFGIMRWDKNGKRHLRKYESINDAFNHFKDIWARLYGHFPDRNLAEKWTGDDNADTWLKHVKMHYNSKL